jgi:sensor histidine kinase regulating citrate/malate metabolism
MNVITRVIKKNWPAKIRYRLILGLMLIHLVLMTFFVFNIEKKQKNRLYTQNHQEAISLVTSVAVNAGYHIQNNDSKGLEAVVKSIDKFPGLKYVLIASADQIILAHTQENLIGTKLQDSVSKLIFATQQLSELTATDDPVHDIVAPILNSRKEIIGWVRIVEEEKDIYREILAISKSGLVYIFIVILSVAVLAFLIGSLLTKGINNLVGVVGEIRAGKKDVRVKKNKQSGIK